MVVGLSDLYMRWLIVKAITSTPIYYTGIGSRETPEPILYNVCLLAELFSSLGLILRSGGAKGIEELINYIDGNLNVPSELKGYIEWLHLTHPHL